MKLLNRKSALLAFSLAVIVAVGSVFGLLTGHMLPPADFMASAGLGLIAIGNVDIGDLKTLLQKQGETFEEFKRANDSRLAEIEKKGHASADSIAQVAKLNDALTEVGKQIKSSQDRMDDMEKKTNRPGAGKEEDPKLAAHKNGLLRYFRKGDIENLGETERKALTAQSDPDGGYLVTAEMDKEIDRVASAEVALRSLATVRTIGGPSYKKLVKTRGVSGGWQGESEEGGETNAPQWAEIEVPAHRVEAEPWIPNDLLEDADYDLEADMFAEAGITFGELEGTAFISGSGVKRPRGILTYTNVANASYAWGKLGYIASGNAGAWAASNPADALISIQHALKQRYRPGANFLMNDPTLATVRQMKDGSGAFYLWQPDNTAGFGGRLLGSPVAIDDNMPDIAANSLSIAFGNFKRGYTIVDRRGIAVIRDNVTKKGTTKFNFSRRVGGGVVNFEAIKLLKFAAS